MKKQLKLPKFVSEDQEREFWSDIDFSDYAEVGDFALVLMPNLQPSSQAISIRIPEPLLFRLKEQANEINVPYQSLIKQYIAKGAAGAARRSVTKKLTPQP